MKLFMITREYEKRAEYCIDRGYFMGYTGNEN